ncbi:MAG: cell division protein FtsZ [Magnetovibrionaceae bacterium]
MPINITVPEQPVQDDLRPRITVIGVGGAGGNAVNNMIASELEGVDFICANTDAQALRLARTDRRIQLGAEVTKGLGAGAKADVGRAAAEESMDDLIKAMGDANMVFIAAGMGGGTGTGAAPVIARAAREQGILTVGVVSKPFHFEGAHRMRIAETGIEELADYVDTLIIIPNQNLFRVANEKTTFSDAFKMADDVLYSGVRGITDLMIMPGLINLDFADVRSVMAEMGKAMMGTGEAEGERRALDAAEAAISNPLLDDSSMAGARGVLINITGGPDMTLFEVDEAANRIRAEVDQDAYIIFGSTFDEDMQGSMRVSVVATGIEAQAETGQDAPTRTLDVRAAAVQSAPKPAPKPAVQPAVKPAAKPAATEQAPAPKAAKTVTVKMQPEPVATDPEPEPVIEAASTVEASEPKPEPLVVTGVETEIAQPAAKAEPEAAPAPAPVAAPAPVSPEPVAFIPPEPVKPAKSKVEATAPAEPFAAADLTNATAATEAPAPVAPEAPKAARKPSLFERVTGIGSKGKDDEPAASAEPVPFGRPAPEAAPAKAPAPVQAPASAKSAPQGGAQAALGGLDAAEQLPDQQDQEDLLEIPAFLRRQAN